MAFPKGQQSGERAGIRWCWPTRRRPIPARTSDDDLLVRVRPAPGAAESLSFEPASAELIEEAEKSLDFSLPPLLKRVLLEIGNGGFGPGRGILGVRGGATDEHGSSLVDLYDGLSAANPEEPRWRWPERLVPICTWGDATYSCVDCSRPGGHLFVYDANGYRPGSDLAHFLVPQDLTLEAWLRAWAEGEDLWSRMFPLD